MCCPLVFEFSVGIGGFVIGLGQISFFFSLSICKSQKGTEPGVLESKRSLLPCHIRCNCSMASRS